MPRATQGRATSRDVAKLANVAQSTVSYYMNGSRPVSKDARARIEAAMKALDYHPNSSARTLKTQRTNLITLIERMDYRSDGLGIIPYLVSIIEQARELGYDVIVNTTKADPDSLVRMSGRSICDGFIMMDIHRDDVRIPVAAQIGVPVVLVGLPADACGLDCVYFDYPHVAKVMIDYLVATGHHHIAFFGEPPSTELDLYITLKGMYETAERHAAERGIDYQVVHPKWDGLRGAEDAKAQLLAHADDRLAIITRQPQATTSIMTLLDGCGLVPGRDVTLLALMSDTAAQQLPHPVTNVSHHPRQLSQTAVRILTDRIENPAKPQVVTPIRSYEVTTRQTTVDWGD